MKPAAAPRSATYAANRRKTFHSVLCHLLQTEFPATFGPAITRLFADKISELFERCHPPLVRIKVGQVLWLAVAANESPGRSKRIEQTRLVPVLLDLVTPTDIDAAASLANRKQTRRDKIVRLFQQAHAQGGVLSEADVGLLMHMGDTTISRVLLDYEEAGNRMVPRRGTVHDLGRSVTHKAIICRLRLVDKKTTSEVAEATYHSPEEVEYYVQCLRRIQRCSDGGMSPDDIALVTRHSLHLVREYLDLIEELGLPPCVDPP
jgi:hypothetical protein